MKFKLEIKWGLIFSFSLLAWMVFEKLMGWHESRIEEQEKYTNLFAVVAILVYVFAFRDKRKHTQGLMGWKQGFLFGLGVTVVVTVLSPFIQYVISELISPEYFPNVIAYVVAEGRMTQDEAIAYFNLQNYIIQSTIWAFAMGVVTSAIVAFFIQKKLPEA